MYHLAPYSTTSKLCTTTALSACFELRWPIASYPTQMSPNPHCWSRDVVHQTNTVPLFARSLLVVGLQPTNSVLLPPACSLPEAGELKPSIYPQVAGALNRTTDRALAAMAMSTSSGAQSQRGGMMLLQGTAGLGYGLIEGAVGLVREPYKGARKEGASGFVKG